MRNIAVAIVIVLALSFAIAPAMGGCTTTPTCKDCNNVNNNVNNNDNVNNNFVGVNVETGNKIYNINNNYYYLYPDGSTVPVPKGTTISTGEKHFFWNGQGKIKPVPPIPYNLAACEIVLKKPCLNPKITLN